MNAAGWHAEHQRQQALLGALDALCAPGPHHPAAPAGACALRRQQALAPALRAYGANAMASARRALEAAYPVMARLLGGDAMAALARDLWHAEPPLRGDLAWFGGGLPAWVAGIEAWAGMPWLADVARLEWALHQAAAAPDAPPGPPRLARLGTDDPAHLRLVFAPGSACVASAWPVWAVWQAHQGAGGDEPDLAAARRALAAGEAQAVWVSRQGLRPVAAPLPVAEAAFGTALLAGRALGPALADALARDPGFSFEQWLLRALRGGWLLGAEPGEPTPKEPPCALA